MDDAPNPATDGWIHKKLWLRWFRILYGVLFFWAAALGFARGSWRWALWPFLAFAAFLIFRSWLQRIEPRIGGTLAFFLGLLLLTHNIVGTLWPAFVKKFPHTAHAIALLQGRTDFILRERLACDAALQLSLADYAFASQDAEAAVLKKEFDALTVARQGGRFGAADELREKELLQRYKQLIQRSADLRRMVSESGCTVDSSSPLTAPVSTAKDNQHGPKQASGGSSNQLGAGVDNRRERLEGFRSLVNSGVVLAPGRRNIAILIEAPVAAGNLSPVQALYGQLRSEDAHFITDLFRHDILTRDYFDDIYQGDPEMLRIATTSTRVDALILGRLSYSFRKGSTVDSELVSCDMGLSYKVVNQSGDVVKSDSFQVIGPGFSESAALERAVQILADQFSNRALKTF